MVVDMVDVIALVMMEEDQEAGDKSLALKSTFTTRPMEVVMRTMMMH